MLLRCYKAHKQRRRTRAQVTGDRLQITGNLQTQNPESTVRPIRRSKNRVGGRYLATFSCNSFGIIKNQVAELVAARVLVATSDGDGLCSGTIASCAFRSKVRTARDLVHRYAMTSA